MKGIQTVRISETQEVTLANCTPHCIRFQTYDGVVEIEPTGYTLPATPQERFVHSFDGVDFVTTKFQTNATGWEEIERMREIDNDSVIIIGSIISAQAYGERVVSLVPVPGFERKPPAEKLYHADKFNTFA